MKPETLTKLKLFIDQNRIELRESSEGLAIDFDLTDEELSQFVELEYGQTKQNVVELFKCIVKKAVKSALEKEDV